MKAAYYLACASLLSVAGHAKTADAAVVSDEPLKQSLKQAICQQDWQAAVAVSSRLMSSSTITPEYRQHLVDWRHRFSQYAAANTRFDEIPNCAGITPKPQVTSAPEVRSSHTITPPPVSVNQLKANLKLAICQQNWQAAVGISSQLMSSSTITAEYRQHLVTWRHQFSQYAASKTQFAEIPNCEGVAAEAFKASTDSVPLNNAASLPFNSTSSRPAQPQVAAGRPTVSYSYQRPSPLPAATPNDARCYVMYSDGRVVNLDSLCK
jgi:hypothetical protein